ncbi:MAG: carbamoyltransferase [Candidatus Rifleibacteriota bacterium]
MKILGINSVYHESAASLVIDGEQICFIEEERINRIKHAKTAEVDNPHVLPVGAMKKCLEMAGLDFSDIDYFAYSFSKEGRLQNIGVDSFFKPGSWGTEEGENLFHSRLLSVPEAIGQTAGFDVSDKMVWVDHHLAHAASAFYCSPFSEALVMIVDGIGEFDSISAYVGRHNQLGKIFSVPYPNSLGFLWEKICRFLGFSEHDACKLMGLSSYGDPAKLRDSFAKIARLDEKSLFVVDNGITRFRSDDMSGLEEIFGPARQKDDVIEMRHKDLAAALQEFTENVMLSLAQRLKKQFRMNKLCLAGGTALNCVANTALRKKAGFSEIYVQPAANDAGTALGAALYVWCGLNDKPKNFHLRHSYYGPSYSEDEIKRAIKMAGLKSQTVNNAPAMAADFVSNGMIVGWFQGKMEMGPRALGNRSLLADPRRRDMRDILNRKIKHREEFRPFAPSVLEEKANEWFEIPGKSVSDEFMLFAFPTRKKLHEKIPAVVHVDNTSRIQVVKRETNPKYHALISEFEKLTGIPMVLNTSFNDSEPIVMSPEDAIKTFLKTGIDVLFLEDQMILKEGMR